MLDKSQETILIQAASGEHKKLLNLTREAHQSYCERHRIEYRPCFFKDGLDRHPMWEKVDLIAEALREGYGKVIWLDADTLIVDQSVDISEGVPDRNIGATFHRLDWDELGVGDLCYDHFCCGALYVPNTEAVREFVQAWWETPDDDHPWHDQHAFNKLLERLDEDVTDVPVSVIDYKWNSIVPYFVADDLVVKAWHGHKQLPERYECMRAEMVKRGMFRGADEPDTYGTDMRPLAPDPGVAFPSRHHSIKPILREQPEYKLPPILSLYESARTLNRDGRYAEARQCFERILETDPQNADVLRQLCEVLGSLNLPEEAERVAMRAIAHDSSNGAGYGLLAACKSWRGDHEEAGRLYEKALSLSPDMPMVHWNYALNLLLRGKYKEGFWVYKWGAVAGQLRKRTLKQEWSGQPMGGGTLWIWCEQGYGDAIMMLRFLPLARKVSGCSRIVLECHDSLVNLFINTGLADEVYELRKDGAIPWEWDEHISAMSLPRALHIDSPEQAACDPYIHAEPLMLPGDGMFKVGVCYRGSSGHSNDHNRSTDFSLWQKLLKTAGCAFFNLDKETSNLPMADWAATARIIASLDLVITVDTAVAHLAGAMGKNVWVLLPFVGDWRWGYECPKTPWYQSASLYRQAADRDWSAAIERVRGHLLAIKGDGGENVLTAGWDGQGRTGHEELIPFADFAKQADKIGRAGTTRHAQALYGLVKWLRPRQVVEVGTWHGYTAVWLARALQELGTGELMCIDDFSLQVGAIDLQKLDDNLAACDVSGVVTISVGKSTEVQWPERVDFAYIDGDHSLKGCADDVAIAIERGARCIVLHDSTNWWGVREYVEKHIPDGYDMIEVEFDEGLAVLMKKPVKPAERYRQEEYPEGMIMVGAR